MSKIDTLLKKLAKAVEAEERARLKFNLGSKSGSPNMKLYRAWNKAIGARMDIQGKLLYPDRTK